MSASCEMNIQFTGSDEEFDALLTKLQEIEGKKKGNYPWNPHYPFVVEEHEIYGDNGSCKNIWGTNYLVPEPNMYFELAKTVPNASFVVESARIYEGGGGGCETYLYVEFKNRILTFSLQAGVDTFSLAELSSWNRPKQESVVVAVVGRLKFHNRQEELADYLSVYDVKVANSITPKVNYIICNNPAIATKSIEKAKLLNIPIISEATAIRMFGDTYDFDEPDKIVRDMTYEEFASLYELDEDITQEVFERARATNKENFILYSGNHVSLEGPWEETVYILNDKNEFELRKEN